MRDRCPLAEVVSVQGHLLSLNSWGPRLWSLGSRLPGRWGQQKAELSVGQRMGYLLGFRQARTGLPRAQTV